MFSVIELFSLFDVFYFYVFLALLALLTFLLLHLNWNFGFSVIPFSLCIGLRGSGTESIAWTVVLAAYERLLIGSLKNLIYI